MRLTSRPSLSLNTQMIIREEAQKLDAHPFLFNGPQMMARATDEKGRIIAYRGRYAHYRAWRRAGDSHLGLGAIGCGLILFDAKGRTLWQKRSEKVEAPDTWGFSAAGGVSTPNIRDNVLAEAKEELGLREEDFISLEPIALFVHPGFGAYYLYAGRIKEGTALHLERDEVVEVAWVENPLEELVVVDDFSRVWIAAENLLKAYLFKTTV
jgi:hypothetical protein